MVPGPAAEEERRHGSFACRQRHAPGTAGSSERLSRHWADAGLAYHYRADRDRALTAIQIAEQIARRRPGSIRPPARSSAHAPHPPQDRSRGTRASQGASDSAGQKRPIPGHAGGGHWATGWVPHLSGWPSPGNEQAGATGPLTGSPDNVAACVKSYGQARNSSAGPLPAGSRW